MRERHYAEYRRGAIWRTIEEHPRFLTVLGRAATEDNVLVCDLPGHPRRVWLQEISGAVLDQGVRIGYAECVQIGSAEESDWPGD